MPVSVPALPESDHSLEIAKPEIRSVRANRAIRPNASTVQMQVNGISIEIDTSVSEEFLCKLIKYDVPGTSIYQKDRWNGIPGLDPAILCRCVWDFF